MVVDLPSSLLEYLVDLFSRNVLDSRNRLLKGLYVRQDSQKVLSQWGGFAGPAAAYLAATPRQGNPFYGNESLAQLALDAGQRLLIDHADVTPRTKPNHFTIYPLARLYELAGTYAGRQRLAKWRDLMARNLKAVGALIDRAWGNLGKPGPWSGTGPNHYFGWFAVGYGQAKLLGEEALADKIARAMKRHMRLQAPGGYFPEHIGPAVLYHQVSLGGLAEFHRLRPTKDTLAAVQRGAAFLVRAMYPDMRGIETFDERNRLAEHLMFQPGLCWSPEGRALLLREIAIWRRRLLDQPAGQPIAGRGWWNIGAAMRCLDHADVTQTIPVAAKLPIDRERFVWRLEDKALVRKQGPWTYALSAWAHEVEQGNPYHLERTQALSIYHQAAGLIIGGGNDKRAYRNATIHVLEGGDCHYFPALAGKLRLNVAPKVLKGNGTCDRIEFDYGSARADLEVRAQPTGQLRIGLATWASQTNPQIWLVLQLPAALPITLRSDGKRIVLKPPKEAQPAAETRLGRTLESPTGWRMTLPTGSSLLWPHIPWNPYRPPAYLDTPDRAVALVRVPLHEHARRAEVTVSVPGET